MAQAWDNTILVAMVRGKKFQIHKQIITGKSAVFEAMFQEGHFVEGEEKRVVIEDTEPTVFDAALKFIYEGRLPDKATKSGKSADELLTLLLQLAEKYEIVSLKQECEQLLTKRVTLANALDLLVVADLINAHRLKQCCIRLINSRPTQVISSAKWKHFISQMNREPLLAQLYEQLADEERAKRLNAINNQDSVNLLDDDLGIRIPLINRSVEERLIAQKAQRKKCMDYFLFTTAMLVLLIAFGAGGVGTYLGLKVAPIWVLIILFILLPIVSFIGCCFLKKGIES